MLLSCSLSLGGLIIIIMELPQQNNFIIQRQMNKKRQFSYICSTLIVVLVATAVFAFTTQLQQRSFSSPPLLQDKHRPRVLYTTNKTRLSAVSTYCSVAQQIQQGDRDTNQMYLKSLSAYLRANSTTLMTNLVNTKLDLILKQLQINGAGTFVFVAPFLLGIVVLLLATPCLVCCCVCQQSCPPSCCRDKEPAYSSGELACPTIFIVVLCLLLVCTTIPAMTNAKPFFRSFNCQISQFFDNFQHGNNTNNQMHFFSGITTIRSQLTSVLTPKLPQVDTQISKLKATASSTMNTAATHATTALTQMQTMPNGVDSLPFATTYNYPLQSSSSSGTLASVVGDQVGSYGVNTSLLGRLYEYVNTLSNNLTAIASAASGVSTNLGNGDVAAQIAVTDAVLATVGTQVASLSDKMQTVKSLLKTIDQYTSQYQVILYGVILGVSLLVLLGLLFVKCFHMLSCRFFLYFLCLLCFLLCLVVFALAIVLSLLSPALYYSCDYLTGKFSSPSEFSKMLSTLQGSAYNDLSANFAQCFGGTNQFITIVSPPLASYISQLKTTVYNSKQYDFTAMTTNTNALVSALATAVDNAGNGKVPDFDPSSSRGSSQIAFFNQVANKSLFNTACPQSTFGVFYQDVWVPGVSSTYQSYVSCGDRVSIDSTNCPTGIASTSSCPSSRCINTFSIISHYYRAGTIASLATDANTRYGTCATFTTYLDNFYNNYVKQVNDLIGNTALDSADAAKLAGRFVTKSQNPVNTLRNYMNADVKSLFTEVYRNLTETEGLQSIFDPDTGLLSGLDCRLLSEDAVNAQQSLCLLTMNRVFFSLVTSGIMAFSLLVVLCCIVCFNFRHYQHSLVKTRKVVPLDFHDQDSTDNIKMG